MIRLKRAYEKPGSEDGQRILVERLWPRGLTKEQAQIDRWEKDIAPSPELRKWYAHDVTRWDEFQRRYRLELEHNPDIGRFQQALGEVELVTFVFAARDAEHSSARILRDFLEG
ncbi:MAG TPA: DUF488 family protein [Anaerolineales bacterium]|nr:DUF488 family protein [Anaerolineales bacterium]